MSSKTLTNLWLQDEDVAKFYIPLAADHLRKAFPPPERGASARRNEGKDSDSDEEAEGAEEDTLEQFQEQESELAQRNFFLLMAFARTFHPRG